MRSRSRTSTPFARRPRGSRQRPLPIAIGEGQSAGNYQSYAGPHYGFLASKAEYTRRLPGRIIGETTDLNGERGYVLTLQTREKHSAARKRPRTSRPTRRCSPRRAHASVVARPAGAARGRRDVLSLGAYAKEQLGLPLAFRTSRRSRSSPSAEPARRRRDSRARAHGVHPGYAIGRDYEGMDDVLLVAVTEKEPRRTSMGSRRCSLEVRA